MRLRRSRARISVVPCGVDHTMFSTEGPVAQRGETPRIVSVGRLLPHKGFDTMIEALPAIPNAEFVIVGGPDAGELDADPEVRRLRALAAGLGVGDRVRFTGAVARDDLPALLRSADVVTCTPSCGPRGLVPLEAMACGVAVVASAVGSMLDIVVHDVTGLLVPPRQPRALAEAVSRVLRDSFLRRSLGLAGRDRACARYSWDRVATDTLRIYDHLASARIPQLPMPADLGQPTIQSGLSHDHLDAGTTGCGRRQRPIPDLVLITAVAGEMNSCELDDLLENSGVRPSDAPRFLRSCCERSTMPRRSAWSTAASGSVRTRRSAKCSPR